jgi:DNA-binding transcriptional regulator YbjK
MAWGSADELTTYKVESESTTSVRHSTCVRPLRHISRALTTVREARGSTWFTVAKSRILQAEFGGEVIHFVTTRLQVARSRILHTESGSEVIHVAATRADGGQRDKRERAG